ncbi:alkaline phosphatase [Desulforamulus profundi]|uniref:Alkaline phosphatase n=1 Tax=Desulforamulus profundi TaxID=1383067 RepID=A0A2C6MG12_9FIRM|nr:alkaline phosphatase [Desulforamulus profundi]
MLAVLLFVLTVPVFGAAEAGPPKYVFYFIGDGMGIAQRQSAEYFKQVQEGNPDAKLLMNTFPVAGLITTHSANDTLITDSAAAGTALATGFKTLNGMLSKLPDGKNVKTLVEAAEEKGMATGIISTTRLTHATPAAFASHNVSRDNENEIAEDLLDSGVDFLAGGGYGQFVPKNGPLKSNRKDNRNLLEEFKNKGYNLFVTENEVTNFKNYQPDNPQKVLACFTYSYLPYEIDRVNSKSPLPSLAEIAEKGIEVLSKYQKGFFMMVEGGRIDLACQMNDARRSIQETLAFDQAIAKAYEFYKKYPNETLILVLADHETGGMALGYGTNGFLNIKTLLDATNYKKDYVKHYTGDRIAYFTYIEQDLGLINLKEDEKAKIERAMDGVEKSGDQLQIYIAIQNVLSNRAGIAWTTLGHTGSCVPISAVGVEAQKFGGFKDNTEIAKTLAILMNFHLN